MLAVAPDQPRVTPPPKKRACPRPAGRASRFEHVVNRRGGPAALAHGQNNRRGAEHDVAAGEYLRQAGAPVFIGNDASAVSYTHLTRYNGKALMEMKVGLTFACMNLKKLAKMKRRKGLLDPVDTSFLLNLLGDLIRFLKMKSVSEVLVF